MNRLEGLFKGPPRLKSFRTFPSVQAAAQRAVADELPKRGHGSGSKPMSSWVGWAFFHRRELVQGLGFRA